MGATDALHYSHALHALHREKEKREKKLEEKQRKLVKIKTRLGENLDAFLQGKHARVSDLSRAFLRQALIVDEEKKKLGALQARLAKAKSTSFASALQRH
ncbi:hypothetical protein J4220_01395 [Candidatus Micrarchaeota archaeon]|nr:hypothetical protein [Candidatus Micrarchaeota archaeon]